MSGANPRDSPAKTVSWRLYLLEPVLPTFGKSFSFRPLSLSSPLKCASSRIRSRLLVSCFCMWPLMFDATIAILHFFRHARTRKHAGEFILPGAYQPLVSWTTRRRGTPNEKAPQPPTTLDTCFSATDRASGGSGPRRSVLERASVHSTAAPPLRRHLRFSIEHRGAGSIRESQ